MNVKTSRSTRGLTALAVALLAIGAPAACARDGGNDASDREKNAPLKLTIDAKPVERSAPAPVSYAPVIDRTSSSVVFVYSTKQVRTREAAPYLDDPILRRFFGIPQGRGSQPAERTQRGLGSGVIVSKDGYILTNNHVIEGADDVKVSIGESVRRYDAKVVGADTLADVAVLKIEATDLLPATLGDSDKLMVGDPVFAIGNPFGVGLSVSRGIVSALSRGNLGIEQIEDFIQTDAAINMGNSGGAMIDSEGRVVGINTAILSRTGGFAGIGFSIPINLVKNVAEQIVNTGKVDRGYLGVAPQPLTPDLATQFNTQIGALIAEVTPGSAAEKAGLEAGDIITKVNGIEIRDPRQLLLTVSQLAPGSSAKIEYLRNGKTATTTATLQRRPADSLARTDGQPEGRDDDGVLDGVGVTDITPEVREQMSIPARVQGAIITQVDPSSPSAQQGLRPGDVILELDRKPVRNAKEAVRLSEEIKGPRVLVRIWREGQSLFVVVDESSEE